MILEMAGDGWADYLVSWKGGAVEAYINTHNLGADTNKRNSEYFGVVAAGITNQGTVHLADVDGMSTVPQFAGR